jgi:hypothetical protein
MMTNDETIELANKAGMKVTCIWLPKWGGYMAIAKADNFEYSQLLKSIDNFPIFIKKAEQHGEGGKHDNN